MYVSLMYRLWKILLSNMSRPETFGMALAVYCNGYSVVRRRADCCCNLLLLLLFESHCFQKNISCYAHNTFSHHSFLSFSNSCILSIGFYVSINVCF